MDRSLQGSLLAALIALEVVLVAVSAWMVHSYLSDAIEQSLYRVHLPESAPIFAQLLPPALGVVGAFALINLFALMLAEAIWSSYENVILQDFTHLIGRTLALDFSGDAPTTRQHEVTALARAWRAGERARLAELRERLMHLESMVSAKSDSADLRDAIDATQRILPRTGG